jgi:uncharacterized membrane protein
MTTQRLEAFSDGVFAILITIMVLELRVPHSADLQALVSLVPVFLTYVLSYVYLGIYWTNHHHLLHLVDEINGAILWANLHLLFWLSLIPFVTGWMGENHFQPLPTAIYGAVLMASGVAWLIMERVIVAAQGSTSKLTAALGDDRKAKVSAVCYALAIPLAFLNQWIADALYVLVALQWLVPDARVEAFFRRGSSRQD